MLALMLNSIKMYRRGDISSQTVAVIVLTVLASLLILFLVFNLSGRNDELAKQGTDAVLNEAGLLT